MSGPEIPEGAVKLHGIGLAYSDIAMVEEPLSRMALSSVIQPVLSLPLKPPPARSGYMSGMVGLSVGAVALNFSNVGLRNNEVDSRLIVHIDNVAISNDTGAGENYNFRRISRLDVSGFSLLPWVPLYIDAGISSGIALGSMTRSNSTAEQGDLVGVVHVEATSREVFPIHCVINNGAFMIVSNVVNKPVFAEIYFHTSPVIQPQARA